MQLVSNFPSVLATVLGFEVAEAILWIGQLQPQAFPQAD
jgi:hypothetical protein